jgi:hypothetical protein
VGDGGLNFSFAHFILYLITNLILPLANALEFLHIFLNLLLLWAAANLKRCGSYK